MSDFNLSPYGKNILIDSLPGIFSEDYIRKETFRGLNMPPDMASIPLVFRSHMLAKMRYVNLPSIKGVDIAKQIDLFVRAGYDARNPEKGHVWSQFAGEPIDKKTFEDIQEDPRIVGVTGKSGSGKTRAVTSGLNLYPQIIRHREFPALVGEHQQIVWLKVKVPSSGNSRAMTLTLMNAWDSLRKKHDPMARPHFDWTPARAARAHPTALANEWCDHARQHFLGILYIDEVQNLFNLDTLANRKKKGNALPELRLDEDSALKDILASADENRWMTILSGTEDGMSAMGQRFAVSQRIMPLIQLQPMTPDDPEFKFVWLPFLQAHQFVTLSLHLGEEAQQIIFKYTAGLPRLIIALWVAAHTESFRRRDDKLTIADLIAAAEGPLVPVASAVRALNSGDPERMACFEDLLPAQGFWTSFWDHQRTTK